MDAHLNKLPGMLLSGDSEQPYQEAAMLGVWR